MRATASRKPRPSRFSKRPPEGLGAAYLPFAPGVVTADAITDAGRMKRWRAALADGAVLLREAGVSAEVIGQLMDYRLIIRRFGIARGKASA